MAVTGQQTGVCPVQPQKKETRSRVKLVFGWILAAGPLAALLTFPLWQDLALWIGRHLPPCYFYQTTGIPCPGCGLTRSITALLHGDILLAMRYNMMPFFLAVFLIPLWIELWTWLFKHPVKILPRGNWFIYTLLGLFLAYMVARNFVPGLQLMGT